MMVRASTSSTDFGDSHFAPLVFWNPGLLVSGFAYAPTSRAPLARSRREDHIPPVESGQRLGFVTSWFALPRLLPTLESPTLRLLPILESPTVRLW